MDTYSKQNNETLRIYKKKTLTEKSSYSIVNYYRCHHNTRQLSTWDVESVLRNCPGKRFKNTNCTFSVSFKVKKVPPPDAYSCTIELQWCHNHPTSALQVLSFKKLFATGLTPGSAYHEFLRNAKALATSKLELHKMLADRSVVPRRPDFNSIYAEYSKEMFGGTSTQYMFSIMIQRLKLV